MSINYKPQDGWAADFIPFYWQGEYHLFYLKDYRNIPQHGEGTPWCHLVTHDFVQFTDLGECLKRGTTEDQDLYVFTGSVVYGEGKFHIFYTGHNPHLRQAGKPEQAIMHAVSDDLDRWEKVEGELFFSPTDRFEPHDWRDPFVFWNEHAGEYWMLTAARLKEGPSRRRGCTGLCTSKDLQQWTVQKPLYAPGLYFTHECPDLFQIGDWWYLIFSEFSDACVTRYRMARSPEGPWTTPPVDTFDGRAFYAAKSATDGSRRFLFGWNPTRVDEKEGGGWQWGGNLVVHEIIQNTDGTLVVRLPESVSHAFTNPAPVIFESAWKTPIPENGCAHIDASETFCCLSAGALPHAAKIETTIRFAESTRNFGLMLRTSPDFEEGYYVRLEPDQRRIVFDAWPRPGDMPHMVELERPLCINADQPVRLTVYIDGSLCEAYVNGQVAMSARMYNRPEGEWGVFVTNGQAEFRDLCLSTW